MAAKETGPAETPVIEEVIDLTLEEFCTRVSRTDRRVELLGGFYAVERAAGRVKDTEVAYTKRLGDFANAPA